MNELHRFWLNEGYDIKAPLPPFTTLEYSQAARVGAENSGYNLVAPGVRYFKIELIPSGMAYRRIELRRVCTKVGT